MQSLTQSQLNAATVIRGLVDLNMINFETDYGYGNETKQLIIDHLSGWDYYNKKLLREKAEAIIEILGQVRSTK